MKRIISVYIILFMAGGFLTIAQEDFKQSINGVSKIELETDTSIVVKTGSSNELVLSNRAECDGCEDKNYNNSNYNWNSSWNQSRREEQKDRAKGLKAIYAGGTDNTGLGLQVERDGDVIRIKDLKSFTQRNGFTLTIPAGVDLDVDGGNLGSIRAEGFSSELELRTNVGSITLVDVTGPITAHTSTGTIEVSFSKVNQDAPISISSSTGIVDVSLPTSTKADIELRSTMGDVFSNFDLEVPREDGMRAIAGQRKIRGQLNNGGVKIKLTSSTGDVYLRKKE